MSRIVRLDPGAEALLPFAEARVAELRRAGFKYASRIWVKDGFTVSVKVHGENSYVSVMGDPGVRYEFLAYDIGYRITRQESGGFIPSHKNTGWPLGAYGIGSGVLHTGRSSRPVLAMDKELRPPALKPGETYPKWDVITPIEMNSGYGERLKYRFLTVGAWNNQKFHQHHWWFEHDPDCMVVSCNACGRGSTWFMDEARAALCSMSSILGTWAYGFGENLAFRALADAPYRVMTTKGTVSLRYLNYVDTSTGVGIEAYEDADVSGLTRKVPMISHEGPFLFDIAPIILTTPKVARVEYGRYRAAANWRHAAMQVVTGSSGKKYEVLISTDKHGVFAFFVMSQKASRMSGDEADEKVVYAEPEWPAWVKRYDVETDPHAHFQWSFNSTGTRASTTPLKIEPTYVHVITAQDVSSGQFTIYGLFADSGAETTYPFKWTDERFAYFGTVRNGFSYVYTAHRAPIYSRKADAPPFDPTIWQELYKEYYLEDEWDKLPITNRTGFFAISVFGQLIPYHLHLHRSLTSDHTVYFSPEHTLDPEHYEVSYTTTPGFMEVEIELEINDDLMSDDPSLTVDIKVVDLEEYTDERRFYVDTDYYIPTPRASGNLADGLPLPAKDTLLTAEIELYWDPADVVEYAVGRMWPNRFPSEEWRDHEIYKDRVDADHYFDAYRCPNNLRPPYGVLKNGEYTVTPSNTVMENYRDLDNAEGMVAGGHCGMHLYIYYTVRERDTQRVVTRLCLGHDVDWHANELNWRDNWRRKMYVLQYGPGDPTQSMVDNTIVPTFFGAVEQAEIRYLSFFTRSYARKGEPYEDEPTFRFSNYHRMTNMMQPRFELRVPGERLRTVDHSNPEYSGFGTDYSDDPMTSLSEPPSGTVKLPHEPSARGFAFCMYQWVKSTLLTITHNDSFSFSPTGSWSAYFDRRVDNNTPPNPSSTEDSGVFDVICNYKKGGKSTYTTHKDEFNAAFGQDRDYSDYDPMTGDIGGFCSHGIWGPRGTRASKVPPDFDDSDN